MKTILFIFNFCLLLIGIGIITVTVYPSIVGHLDHIDELKSAVDSYKNIFFPSTELIIIGSIISLISFYGCCGAATKNTFYLKIYAALNLVVIVGLIVITVIGYYKFKDLTSNDVENFIGNNFNSNKYNDSKSLIDLLQSSNECCGVSGKESYGNTKDFPLSCCTKNYTDNVNDCYENAYQTNCTAKVPEVLQRFNTTIDKVKKILLYIALGAGIIELVAIIFSLKLAQSITNTKRRSYGV